MNVSSQVQLEARSTRAMCRFAVEWLVSSEPGRLTHVMLLDRERPASYLLAVGHGPDKAHALLDLWRTLKQEDTAPEAIDYIAAEYVRRTGMAPEMPSAQPELKGRRNGCKA